MTTEDWHDDLLRVIGMFVSGSPLRSPGPRGEVLHDASFLLWLNGSAHRCDCTLPRNKWIQSGSVVLSTDPSLPIGTQVFAGETLALASHSLVLLQADAEHES
jgi:glycogen operon protein